MTDATPTPIASQQWEAVLRAALGPPTIDHLSRSMASSLVAHNQSILRLSVVLSELTARVEALEAQQQQAAPCPHIVTSDEGTSYCGLAEQQAQPAEDAEDVAGVDGELLTHLAHMTANFASSAKPGEDCTPFARFAIRIVARWLRAQGHRIAADLLEEEAGR